MHEVAIARLAQLRSKLLAETWKDRKAQDCTIGGITLSIEKLKSEDAAAQVDINSATE